MDQDRWKKEESKYEHKVWRRGDELKAAQRRVDHSRAAPLHSSVGTSYVAASLPSCAAA